MWNLILMMMEKNDMSFWKSDLGELTGSAEDAFSRQFRKIPDSTMALAKIIAITNEDFNGKKHLKVDWELVDGEFSGQHVFQKIHVFDEDSKKRHKALNMLMLLYKMFGLSPKSNNPPTDAELMAFNNKVAGIRVQETLPNDEGKTYNWVSECHPAQGFKCVTGVRVEVTHNPNQTAFDRNPRGSVDVLDDDLPF